MSEKYFKAEDIFASSEEQTEEQNAVLNSSERVFYKADEIFGSGKLTDPAIADPITESSTDSGSADGLSGSVQDLSLIHISEPTRPY